MKLHKGTSSSIYTSPSHRILLFLSNRIFLSPVEFAWRLFAGGGGQLYR